MSSELIESAADTPANPPDKRVYGLCPAVVKDNIDLVGQGRVQVTLPSFPDFEPWARVAVPLAGRARGTYWIPQVDDEVVVGFAGGDLRDAYVLGSLWNGLDVPPVTNPLEASTRFLFKTPLGHQLDLDDLTQTVEVTTLVGHKVTLDATKVTVATAGGTASIELSLEGSVAVKGSVSITLEAPSITIKGATIDVQSSGATTVNGGGSASVQAGVVRIN